MNILSYRLPSSTPDPSRHSSCGWIAIIDGKEVGWCNMSFLPHNTLKFEDAFVDPDYRGKGIYRKLWDTRWEYVTKNFKGMKVIAYCKPITVGFYEEKGFEDVDKITLVEKTIT